MPHKRRQPKPPRPQDVARYDSLGMAIFHALNLADAASLTPVDSVFGTVRTVLKMIQVTLINEQDYVDLGRELANVYEVLRYLMKGRRLEEFSQHVCEAIQQLSTTVAEIHKEVTEISKRIDPSGFVRSEGDTEAVAAWRQALEGVNQAFYTQPVLNPSGLVSLMRREVMTSWVNAEDKHHAVRSSFSPGELPPRAPRDCFGRDELIETVVSLAENIMPIALIGAGGIGKTSIALRALHNDRVKKRFGHNRRFVRCDQFPPSRIHFLRRLSDVIGAGVRNPENLASLHPFLSSKEMIIVLDNAESILDSPGADSQEIFTVVEKLSSMPNICVCITSRTSTVPIDCRYLEIPTFSPKAALETFYRIYDKDEQQDRVKDILEQLGFHPLSITLLATAAQCNKWDADELAIEWEGYRTAMLHTKGNKSLATTIELSLASPTFQELGPSARELLGVVAFFPQGVYEKHLEWLFPDVSNRADIFASFCALSLTHRSNGYITMLAPLRDYLRPKDSSSSELLCATKQCYFARLAANIPPAPPGCGKGQWIAAEDVNVEHLLDIFATLDRASDDVWDACGHFLKHLTLHKPRLVELGSRCEALPDDHWSKPECLFWLSQLSGAVGNVEESKRLLTHILSLWKDRGGGRGMARTLTALCDANRMQGLYKEGIQQGTNAIKIYGQLGDVGGLAQSLHSLALVLDADSRWGSARAAASLAVKFHMANNDYFGVCKSKRLLGNIYHSTGKNEKAKKHLGKSLEFGSVDEEPAIGAALEIASSCNWHDQLSSIHHFLAWLSFGKGEFEDVHAHIEYAKSHAVNDKYKLGHGMESQAYFLCAQRRFKEAHSEALRCIGVYKQLGVKHALQRCEQILGQIQSAMDGRVASGESG